MNAIEHIASLSSPLFHAGIGIFFGSVALSRRRYHIGIGIVAATISWLWLCSSPIFAISLLNGLENQYPSSLIANAKADAIVILGGGPLPHPGAYWSPPYATRLEAGADLYRDSRAPTVLLSGGNNEAQRMARILSRRGLPREALRTEDASTSTRQNATYTATLLKQLHLHSIFLVTSAAHMPRAMASFRKAGMEPIPIAVHDTDHALGPSVRSWRPQWPALKLTERCLREYFGLWLYRALGWA